MTQRQTSLLAFVSSALLLGSTAHAQRTGTLVGSDPAQIPEGPRANPEDRVRIAMYRYAECVVGNSRARVERYLDTFPGSKVAHKMANSLAVDECLSSGEMRFSESLFRAGVYDVLYRRDFKTNGPVDFSSVPALDYAAGEAGANDREQSRVALRNIADCTVRNDPKASRALILSMVAGNAEANAFTTVVSSMSPCVMEGSTLTFSKSVFRGVIGETLYRLSVAARQTAVATKD